MALSLADIDALPDYTAAYRLKLVRYAIAQVLAGGAALSTNGRSMTRADLKDLKDMEAALVTEIADTATTTDSGDVLVQFGDAQ